MAKRTRWLLALGALAAVLVSAGLFDLLGMSARQVRYEWELARLKREQARLLAQRERLKNDPTYVEGLIRTTFKRSKRGELVIPLNRDR